MCGCVRAAAATRYTWIVDVGKRAVGHQYHCWIEVDELVYLAPWAKQARPGHECDGLGQERT